MLDSFTLVISLALTFTLQAILFLLMTFFIKAYNGMRLWAYGCIGLALNFISIYVRSIGFSEEISVMASNSLSIFSLLCFYFGTKQIMGMPFNLKWGIWSSIVFLTIIAYYTFICNHLNERIIVYSAMMAIILIMNSRLLVKYRQGSFKVSAFILAGIFFLIGIFFLYRSIHSLFFPALDNNFFTNHGIQPITLLISLCLGILWTQGIILLVNQKLQGDLTNKTEELEATNTEKDKFFSVLAHDLRGPLTTIMGMVDLLADKKSELGEQLMQEMAESMKKSIHSTNILMDNLLDWASLQRGLNEIQKVQTTYGELMVTVMPTLLIQAESKKVIIEDDIPAATPLTADLKMVQSIFRNLLANAIKFTPSYGKIQLNSSIANDGRMVFSVKDNGIGMDKIVMDNLFKITPHSRRTGTDGENSTGLGLMICKEFVDKHGGQIWIESEIGKGSTFSFCLEPEEKMFKTPAEQ
jgi:signal transduction histidine kinase